LFFFEIIKIDRGYQSQLRLLLEFSHHELCLFGLNFIYKTVFLGRRALELILADWSGVKSMLLCGCPDDIDPTLINFKQTSSSSTTCPPIMSTFNNDNIFSLDQQQQTSQLDRFTYFLLAKCNTIKQTNCTTSKTNDLLDILLNTLVREMSNNTHRDMARYVTARFVRSVARLFLILSLQSIPDKSSTTIKRSTTNTNLSSTTLTGPQLILFQCKRIFQTLTIISIDVLVHMSDLLLAPVRHGIAKPTAMFNLLSTHTDILQSLEEVFNIDSEYYRAYQENNHSDENEGGDLNETDIDNIFDNTNTNPAHIDLIEEDDNNSDAESQHETINNLNLIDRQTARENVAGLSDNESEMELELLAESDTDNESNRSAPNTNTHRTSATAGSENMPLFSDDENSDSDDADSVRSDSVLGEGDETSQPEPMIFDDARDALAAAAAASSTATSGPTITNDRLVLLPSGNNNTSGSNTQTANPTSTHLNVPRLTTRAAIAGLYYSFEMTVTSAIFLLF
jgi:E3 ubiquitin-protein ligase EDD1